MKILISTFALRAVRHIEVIGVIHGDVFFPAPKSLANVQTGLGDHDPIQIIIAPLQSLAQAITTEGAKHAAINMGLHQTGGFMPSQNPDGKHVRSVEYLRGCIGAEVTDDFPSRPFLPLPRIIMSLIDPILKSLIQFLTSFDNSNLWGQLSRNSETHP